MMLPTHAVVGLALAAPLAVLAPEFAPVAAGGALVGSLVPDLDMYAGHRRTLHFPTLYPVAAVAVGVVALAVPATGTVTLAFALLGAAVHCRMDRYGGGLELRPWEGTSDRAVYDHVRGRWREPKRWVAYDGSAGDMMLATVLGVPLLVVFDEPVTWVVALALAVGGTYALLRRRLAAIAPTVFGAAPNAVKPYVPERYLE